MDWIVANAGVLLGALGVVVMVGRFVAPITATKVDDFIVDALDTLLKFARGKSAPKE